MTLFTRTTAEMKKAERIQAKLYARFSSVQVAPHGLDMIKITAN